MRNNCTIGKLSERNKAGDEEAIHRRNRSCMSGVGVAQPWSELYVQSRTWTVPLHQSAPPLMHHLIAHPHPHHLNFGVPHLNRVLFTHLASSPCRVHQNQAPKALFSFLAWSAPSLVRRPIVHPHLLGILALLSNYMHTFKFPFSIFTYYFKPMFYYIFLPKIYLEMLH